MLRHLQIIGIHGNMSVEWLAESISSGRSGEYHPMLILPPSVPSEEELLLTRLSRRPLLAVASVIYERSLRDECGYSGAHPYWDWTVDAKPAPDWTKSPVFNPVDGFGGNGPLIPVNQSNPFEVQGAPAVVALLMACFNT
ncbi:uncharacterized protein BDZ99DRAFT_514474 [Mytilinidion resinicola]|uniref:Tyrosinase copper-binding domain-containing protein n=1 Tax=Mytilinidion resinicola TaxID=574789 RepID=A0A6A6Z3V1_9PEZI|nr:uncharacterized protein BDZ99DRAFT_514474 [Mytilinidion resinicola]KAF2815832.1 hypothetical protein BDZ99DRAFT_514474 [Mytilinidion resinicola]